MSAPPSGGPPPSQPPYPQQYPPQPSYAQPMPPPKKSNALLIVIIVVVVIVVLAAVAWYAVTLMFKPVTNPQVRVTGVSWTVNYPGSTHYFDSSPLTTCSACPITVSFPDYQFTYTLVLTNSDTVAHNVTAISVSGLYFNLVSGSPTTGSPVSIGAGLNHSFVLTIGVTPLSGDRTLSGTITTT